MKHSQIRPLTFESLATSMASVHQRQFAATVVLLCLVATVLLLPVAPNMLPQVPGFTSMTQTAVVMISALTGVLFITQYRRTASPSLLVLACGSLYTTGIVLLQLACMPNMLAPWSLMHTGPETMMWLYAFWHLGLPATVVPYALLERFRSAGVIHPERVKIVLNLGFIMTGLALVISGWLAIGYPDWLPQLTDQNGYAELTTSGLGPALIVLTALALLVLCAVTRLRAVLHLWLSVSLFLLIADDLLMEVGARQGSVGWIAGRALALLAGTVVLSVFLRELDVLHGRAEAIAIARERARAEAEYAHETLAFALNAAEMGHWSLDLATDTSRRTLRHDQIFGYKALQPQWGFGEFMSHVRSDDQAAVTAAFAAAMICERLDIECRIRRDDDGAERWIAIMGRLFRAEDGSPPRMDGFILDTTARHETEARLREAERMEAVGQLTGGVAHDFNNLLTVIMGSLDLMVRWCEDPKKVRRISKVAMTAAQRGAGVTSQLLSFSRRQVVAPETVSPNHLLRAFLPLLQRAAQDRVSIILDLDPDLGQTHIDRRQFEAALLNVIVNARDAMPDGGRVTICSRVIDVTTGDTGDTELADLTPGPYLSIGISDEGVGMSVETARRAFEPFFTTKDVGKGTGLGLSQVYGFARQANGTVRIRSEPGHGATVEIILPAAAADVPHAPLPAPSQPNASLTGEGVVLIVEDNAEILAMITESLRNLGFMTMAAADSVLALEYLRGPERIDALFTDLILPGKMSGLQLATEARRLRPSLRLLLASGSSMAHLAEAAMAIGGAELIEKPYRVADIASALRLAKTPS